MLIKQNSKKKNNSKKKDLFLFKSNYIHLHPSKAHFGSIIYVNIVKVAFLPVPSLHAKLLAVATYLAHRYQQMSIFSIPLISPPPPQKITASNEGKRF